MNKPLQEVLIIRPIVIVLLVLMHSFTIYSGGWELPQEIGNVSAYFWIQKTSFAFMLEMFAFISGYLFAYQMKVLKKEFTFWSVLKNKFHRLIIPCVIFSLLYIIIIHGEFSNILELVYKLFSGVGHMWFLNMLFWCFLGTYVLRKIKINEILKILFLFLCANVSFLPLPFQMTSAMYYIFFFYVAFYILENKSTITNKFLNIRSIVILGSVFVLTFILFTLFREQISIRLSVENNIFYKALLLSLSNFLRLTYASLGLFWFYLFVLFLLKFIKQVPKWIISINALCMGIYIIHQFLLQYLYYQTHLPQYLGTYVLPWVAFLSSLFLSLFLSYFIRKTRLGKQLL
jgi:fucose 4-O-acetylase-like acetyltransferase